MNAKHHNNKYYKYDDWVCLLCQNYNYSFRSTCKPNLIQATDVIYKLDNKIIT